MCKWLLELDENGSLTLAVTTPGKSVGSSARTAGPAAAERSASLHDAFSEYEKFIRREFYRPEMEQLTQSFPRAVSISAGTLVACAAREFAPKSENVVTDSTATHQLKPISPLDTDSLKR